MAKKHVPAPPPPKKTSKHTAKVERVRGEFY